ncbi:hypothetical protein KCU65_g180, partial [Aureobasidium melanogenum]
MVVLWRRPGVFISHSRSTGPRALVPFGRVDLKSMSNSSYILLSLTRLIDHLALARRSGVKSEVPQRVPHERLEIRTDDTDTEVSSCSGNCCNQEGLWFARSWHRVKHGRCSTNLQINRAGKSFEIVQIRCAFALDQPQGRTRILSASGNRGTDASLCNDALLSDMDHAKKIIIRTLTAEPFWQEKSASTYSSRRYSNAACNLEGPDIVDKRCRSTLVGYAVGRRACNAATQYDAINDLHARLGYHFGNTLSMQKIRQVCQNGAKSGVMGRSFTRTTQSFNIRHRASTGPSGTTQLVHALGHAGLPLIAFGLRRIGHPSAKTLDHSVQATCRARTGSVQ